MTRPDTVCVPGTTPRDATNSDRSRTVVLKAGQSYQVADNTLGHRSRTATGATLFIVD